MQIKKILIGLYLLFAALSPGWLASQDASARLVIARTLWQKGTVFINGTRPERFVETPHGYTTYFGIGQSLAFIPFDMLGFVLGKMLPESSPLQGQLQLLPLLFLYAPLIGLLWWALNAKLFEACGLDKSESVKAALLGILSTIALVYISQSLQDEAVLGALVSATLYSLLLWQKSRKRTHAVSFGFFFGLALLFRLNVVFILFPLAGIFLDSILAEANCFAKSIRFLKEALWGSLLPLGLLLMFNQWRFDSPWLTGYALHYSQLAHIGIHVWRPVNIKMALALLFGAGKGFFILSPPLLLSGFAVFNHFRRQKYYLMGLVLCLATSALFYSKLNGFSCGGHCWGARFQVHLLPLFVPSLAKAWQLFKTHWIGRLEVYCLLLLGMAIQLAAMAAPESLEYVQEIGRLGDYKEELITSSNQGQLPLRLQNLWHHVQHHSLGSTPATLPYVERFEQHHMPNYWGYSYASFAESKIMQCIIFGFWSLSMGLGVAFLLWGLGPLVPRQSVILAGH